MELIWIFDLDGTLIDSAPGIYASYTKAITGLGIAPVNYLDFRTSIGPTFENMCTALHKETKDDRQLREGIVKSFRSDYDTRGYLNYRVYPGIHEIFKILRNIDAKTYILSNKKNCQVIEIVSKEFGLADSFCHGRGMDFTSKLDRLFSILHGKSCRSCYVGDTLEDYEISHRLGSRFIWAKYGYGSIPDKYLSEDQICLNSLSLKDYLEFVQGPDSY